jgi:predicted  nucleic acid-binding Zn-ribbon protein
MGTPALQFTPETSVEERLARLETHLEHIQTDIADTKIDIRRLNDKVDGLEQRLLGKMDGLDQKLSRKIESLDQKTSEKIEGLDRKLLGKVDSLDQKMSGKIDMLVQAVGDLKVGRMTDRVWWLLMSAAQLGVLAKAFKWI